MTDVYRSGPLEIRVLETLTSGPLSAVEVALRTGESEDVVSPLLERSVADQSVTRIKLTHAPAYSLTPKGLYAIAVHQGTLNPPDVQPAPEARPAVDAQPAPEPRPAVDVQPAVAGVDDPEPDGQEAEPLVTEGSDVARPVSGETAPAAPPALPSSVDPAFDALGMSQVGSEHVPATVRWRHVLYAAAYVVLGLFILLLLHSVVGVLAILAGLGLGAWTLRPLYAKATPGIDR